MKRPLFEVSQIIRRFEGRFIDRHNPHIDTLRVFHSIKNCRTAEMGWHKERCQDCGHERISYNSCRNRHCPKCQGLEREIWIEKTSHLIPSTDYFHVVFTVPESLNPLFLSHKKDMQNVLFSSAWQTIEQFSINPKYMGAELGMIGILHTWGQTLVLHPHLHCIVSAGGIDKQDRWVRGKYVDNKSQFLFPVRLMAPVFRGIFLSRMSAFLKKKKIKGPTVKETIFNVFAKQPFRGVNSVIEYLGRYTHKVAISNHRIRSIDNEKVSFQYKDYRDQNKQKLMTLTGEEFLRRFALHIQPKGYRRIRSYGILAACKRKTLNKVRKIFHQQPISSFVKKEWKKNVLLKWDIHFCQCPVCAKGQMVLIETVNARPPPNKEIVKI